MVFVMKITNAIGLFYLIFLDDETHRARRFYCEEFRISPRQFLSELLHLHRLSLDGGVGTNAGD